MAVPSSGAISMAGLAAEKLNNDYGDADFDDVISLTDLFVGGDDNGSHEEWPATNTDSDSFPNTSTPHAMSEWYGYDHDAEGEPTFVNAKAVSKALQTGVNHNIQLLDTDDTFNFTGSSAWTISFWVKAGWSSSLNTNIHFIIGQKENAPYQLTDMIKIMYNESNNRLRAHYGNKTTSSNGWSKFGEWLFHSNSAAYAAAYAAAGLGGTFWSASNRGYVNSDNYTMITITKSTVNDAGAMKLYWNANGAGAAPIQTNNSVNGAMSSTNNRTWSVGSNGISNGESKCGNSSETVYNDLTIWNKTLSASEVTSLYNSGTVMDATTHSASESLVGYWQWEGNGNATVSNDNFTIDGNSAIVNK